MTVGEAATVDNFKYDQLPEDTDELCSKSHITELTPFQRRSVATIWHQLRFGTLPVFTYPNDLYLWSPTGSGKTLAFALPIVSYLRRQSVRGLLRVIALAPTENLVRQLYRVFSSLLADTDCRVNTADELLRLSPAQHAPSILITTIGLISPLTRRDVNFKHVRFLVLDEADKLLGKEELQPLLTACGRGEAPKNPTEWSRKLPPLQKIMASATLDLTGSSASSLQCYEPLLLKAESDGRTTVCYLFARIGLINEPTVPAGLEEFKLKCSSETLKPLALAQLLKEHGDSILPAIIFTDSRKEAHNLFKLLPRLYAENCRYHLCTGDKRPAELPMPDSRSDRDVYVCSDLMARGMDTCVVKCVIQYNAPRHLTTYVHRVGRTARAGQPGKAITLVTPRGEAETLNALRGRLRNVKIDKSHFDLDRLQVALQEVTAELRDNM